MASSREPEYSQTYVNFVGAARCHVKPSIRLNLQTPAKTCGLQTAQKLGEFQCSSRLSAIFCQLSLAPSRAWFHKMAPSKGLQSVEMRLFVVIFRKTR